MHLGIFIAQVLVIIAAILAVFGGIIAIASKSKDKDKSRLSIKKLNTKYDEMKHDLHAEILTKKALKAALGNIERQFGKGSVMRLGDSTIDANMGVYSTGSLGLDIALGVGGLPKGRVVEIYGPESSGKTTLTLQVIAEMQKNAILQLMNQVAQAEQQANGGLSGGASQVAGSQLSNTQPNPADQIQEQLRQQVNIG